MNLRPVGEGSSFTLSLTIRNSGGDAVTPVNAKYRVDCLTNGRTVRDWTSVTPSTEMVISVAPEDNVILNERNSREQRQLTMVANDGVATQFVDPDPVVWWVNNTLPGRNVIP